MLHSALARGLDQLLLRVVRGPSEAPFLDRTAMSLWPWVLRWLGEVCYPGAGVVTLQGTGDWAPGQALWGGQAAGVAWRPPHIVRCLLPVSSSASHSEWRDVL